MLQRHGVQMDVVSVPSHKNAFTVKTAKRSAVVRALPACLAYFSSPGGRAQHYANPNPAACEVLSSDGCTGECRRRATCPADTGLLGDLLNAPTARARHRAPPA